MPDHICPHCGADRLLTPGRMMTCVMGCEPLLMPTESAMKYIRSVDIRKEYPPTSREKDGTYIINGDRYIISRTTKVKDFHEGWSQVGEILAVSECDTLFQVRCFTPVKEMDTYGFQNQPSRPVAG